MRVGTDAQTGQLITGWDHCVQSMGKLLSTRFATRPARRHLGNDVPELQDANASTLTIFKAFASVADALGDPDGGEPGFALQSIEMAQYGRDGRFVFILDGIFYPRGHLGDYSVFEPRSFPAGGLA